MRSRGRNKFTIVKSAAAIEGKLHHICGIGFCFVSANEILRSMHNLCREVGSNEFLA